MTAGNHHCDKSEALADAIIGYWSPQWSIGDGDPTSAENLRNVPLTLSAERYEVCRGGNQIRIGTYTTGSAATLSTLEACTTESEVPELIDATLRGIYEIADDRLRICFGPSSCVRARSFCGDRGTGQYLAEYR